MLWLTTMLQHLKCCLKKCFFTKEQLNREEALQAVPFLLGSVEKEAHKK